MRHYIRLIRPKHWIKNLLVLLPLLCSGQFLNTARLVPCIWAFFAFSLLASSIYIINDIRDRENDRKNPSQAQPPHCLRRRLCLQSNAAVHRRAGAGTSLRRACQWSSDILLGSFSFLLSAQPDLQLRREKCSAAGHCHSRLRLSSAGDLRRHVTGIPLSHWLCLTVTAASFYLSLGKRRGELLKNPDNPRPRPPLLQPGFSGEKYVHVCGALHCVLRPVDGGCQQRQPLWAPRRWSGRCRW